MQNPVFYTEQHGCFTHNKKNSAHAPVLNTEIDMAELQQHKDNLHACALTDTVLIDLTSTSIDVKGMQEKVESSFNPTAKKKSKM